MCSWSAHGVEESKGSDGVEEGDCDAAAALPHAVAPVGAPSAVAEGLHGEWRDYRNRAAARSSVGSVKTK
jgi:hypothetical protein